MVCGCVCVVCVDITVAASNMLLLVVSGGFCFGWFYTPIVCFLVFFFFWGGGVHGFLCFMFGLRRCFGQNHTPTKLARNNVRAAASTCHNCSIACGPCPCRSHRHCFQTQTIDIVVSTQKAFQRVAKTLKVKGLVVQ